MLYAFARPSIVGQSNLISLLRPYRARIALTSLFLLLSAASALAIPFNLGSLVDHGFSAENMDRVAEYAWLIAGFGVVGAVTAAARLYLVSYIGERFTADVRNAVFGHLLTLDNSFFDKTRVGELSSRLNGDTGALRTAITTVLPITLRSVVTIAGAVTLMLLTSGWLTLALVIVAPLVVIPMLLMVRRLRAMSRHSQSAMAELSAFAIETLGAPRTIKSFTREAIELGRYRDRTDVSFTSELRRLKLRSVIVAVLLLLATAGMTAIILWGAAAVFDGAVTAGQLAQFLIYCAMAASAMASLAEVAGAFHTLAGSTDRIVELLGITPAIRTPAEPADLPTPAIGTIEFRNVGFQYGESALDPVLQGLNFTVEPGRTVALVGMSGVGKSTIFALAQRFHDVGLGAVLVDGTDVRRADLTQLRKRIAVVDQDPTMFSGSVADNIRIGRPDAPDDVVIAAAKAAHVHDFVQSMPGGYQTQVGERGVMLSGGQRQRLAIARALVKDAPILLLDEATSALDPQSEQIVQDALMTKYARRTVLVIAHRLATIREANEILVLDKGRIAERGNHNSLRAMGGIYSELCRLQFGDGGHVTHAPYAGLTRWYQS